MADEAAIRDLFEKMEYERGRLLALLESLSEEEASRPAKPGEWTPKEQMAHLCEMEAAYRAWVERAIAEENPTVDGIRGEPVAVPLERANQASKDELLAEMRRQREKTLALMRRLRPEDYDRTATSSVFGTLTVLQWLRSYYRHDRMHYDQVQGQEPTYRPRYLSGQEPDQRRRPQSA
ncbi:hypothetical protein HRbin24_00209 [bacterium HR24]|nr:hypothetical protein HRbin24_00209 [bacterium HR24]